MKPERSDYDAECVAPIGASFSGHSHIDGRDDRRPPMNKVLKVTLQEMFEIFDLAQPASRPRILVVDDDPDIRHLMSDVLAGSSYHVDTAENGTRAWEALQAKRCDLLVTDHEMPGLTGLQLVTKLRLAGMRLPVILASGSPPFGLSIRNTTTATTILLPKPFTLGELLKLVENLLPQPAPSASSCLDETDAEPWVEIPQRFNH